MGVTLGIKPTALHLLEISQFQKITVNDGFVWIFTEKVESREGASKTARGGWRDTNYRPVTIDIWNIYVLDNFLNVYQEIDDYFKLREKMSLESDRFFLQTSRKRNKSFSLAMANDFSAKLAGAITSYFIAIAAFFLQTEFAGKPPISGHITPIYPFFKAGIYL